MKWAIILFTLFLVGCSPEVVTVDQETGVGVTEDGTKYLVDPAKIMSGGPPKDGIPSIDNPEYVSVSEADEWIEDNELVLALVYDGVKRVYPLQVLVWHEIVNDEINGDHVLVTYCPLCGSGIAYEGYISVNGERVPADFGTTGKLYQSNLIMYDRVTDTYWQQIDGNAIVGELVGQELVEVSIDTVVWRDWKVAHPDSEVLSQETGYSRPYGKDPYGSYYENSNLFFPVDEQDNRIHAKTQIVGVEINGAYKAYRRDDVSLIEDTVGGVSITLQKLDDGRIVIEDSEGNEIVKEEDFWFAWYAFHPTTELYS